MSTLFKRGYFLCECCKTQPLDIVHTNLRLLGYCSDCIQNKPRCCKNSGCIDNPSKSYCRHCVPPYSKSNFISIRTDLVQYLRENPTFNVNKRFGYIGSYLSLSLFECALFCNDFELFDELLSSKDNWKPSSPSRVNEHFQIPSLLQIAISWTETNGLDFTFKFIQRLLQLQLANKEYTPLYHSPFATALDLPLSLVEPVFAYLFKEEFVFPETDQALLLQLHPVQDKDKLLWLGKNLPGHFADCQTELRRFCSAWLKIGSVWTESEWYSLSWLTEVYQSWTQSKLHSNNLLLVSLVQPGFFPDVSFQTIVKPAVQKLQSLGAIDLHCDNNHLLLKDVMNWYNDRDALEVLACFLELGLRFDFKVFSLEFNSNEDKFVQMLEIIVHHQSDFDVNGVGSNSLFYLPSPDACQAPLSVHNPENVLRLLQMGADPNYQLSRGGFSYRKYAPLTCLHPTTRTELQDVRCWSYMFTFGLSPFSVSDTSNRNSLCNSNVYNLWKSHCTMGIKSLFLLAFDAVHSEHRNFGRWAEFLGPILSQDIVAKRNLILTSKAQGDWALLESIYKENTE